MIKRRRENLHKSREGQCGIVHYKNIKKSKEQNGEF